MQNALYGHLQFAMLFLWRASPSRSVVICHWHCLGQFQINIQIYFPYDTPCDILRFKYAL